MTDQATAVPSNDAKPPPWLDMLTALGRGKRLIGFSTLIAIGIGIVIALVVPPTFTARASLMPPSSQQGGGGAAASLAALSALGGLSGGLGVKTPDELYVALLRSDSVTRVLGERFGLMARYQVNDFEALRRALARHVRISADKKSGIITIEVDDKEPKFAAELANAHTPEVAKLMTRLAVSEAQQRRVFFEQQLKETKENLVKAETALRHFQEKSGMLVLEKQAEALLGGVAQLRSLIADREVRLRVLRTSATAQNPEVIRLNTEVSALRAELARLETAESGASSSGPTEIAVGRLPEAAIEYLRARRELKLQETLLEAMVRQYELAKLDEAKEGPLLQQVDVALPPDAKSRPSRGLIIITMTVLGLFISACGVLFKHFAKNGGAAAITTSDGWLALRQAWKLNA